MVLPIRPSVSEDVVTHNMAKCHIPSPKDPRSNPAFFLLSTPFSPFSPRCEFKSWQDFEVWVSQLKNLKPLQTKNTLFQILFIFCHFIKTAAALKKVKGTRGSQVLWKPLIFFVVKIFFCSL